MPTGSIPTSTSRPAREGNTRRGLPVALVRLRNETDQASVRDSMTTHSLITTPFGFDSTAAEVIAGIDLTGKRAIVTGGSSGIGIETARALVAAGADVTLA